MNIESDDLSILRDTTSKVLLAMLWLHVPLSAVIGLAVFRDNLHPLAWVGVAITTLGLAVLTWPKGATGPQPLSGALFDQRLYQAI